MPYIEKETGVKIRFLVAKSSYVVGSDFIGEEINDIADLKPAIKGLVEYVGEVDEDFTIRIHAGENVSLRDNVAKSIKCVKEALKPGQKMPKVRLGYGLYTANLEKEKGKQLMQEMRDSNVILEFQLTSNVRLNNLSNLDIHPLKTYLQNGIRCVQGTDGCGFYSIDTIDEQLALQNLLGLTDRLNGIRISIKSDEMGIYKSFNYEIFERRKSVVMAFDGNWSVSNLVQEAKNGKGKAKIYVNEETPILSDKAKTLGGYVIPFNVRQNIVERILEDNPEIVEQPSNVYKKIDL